MREQYVEVELIKNPSVKRQMNVNSFKMNQKKWRLASGESLTAPVKKKVVEPVVKVVTKEPEVTSEFAQIGDDSTLDDLRAQYETKTGKKPDGRWNVSRLTKEINA